MRGCKLAQSLDKETLRGEVGCNCTSCPFEVFELLTLSQTIDHVASAGLLYELVLLFQGDTKVLLLRRLPLEEFNLLRLSLQLP